MRSRLAAAACVVCCFAACTDEPSRNELRPRAPRASPTSETTTVIGLVGTMSGIGSWRGTDAFEGAQFGVQALNRNLDGSRPRFELVTLDDRGEAERAATLVAGLAANPRTAGVIYAGPTPGLPPAQTALAEAGVPGILCYGDLYSARLLRSHLFQMSPPHLWQARAIAAYVTRDRRYRKVGVLTERFFDGRNAAAAVRTAFAEVGEDRPIVTPYAPSPPSLSIKLSRLERERASAVIVPASRRVFDDVVDALRDRGASYRTTALARRGGRGDSPWRPQVIGLDAAIHTTVFGGRPPGAGTVAADSYARGAHYLPVPSFQAFRKGFVDWWGEPPLGWEVRAYQAVQMIGWASLRTDPGDDVAATLERLRGARFGGLDITFGPDDHTAVDQTTIGLWTVPRPGIPVPERDRLPEALPWVPLARAFAIDGDRTDVLPEDWAHLFRGQTRRNLPSPKFERMRFGVTTPRSDPVH
jgi:ABC-type branched-subunit amino acid transport system substrate-binding protein